MKHLDNFTRAYIECALWSSYDNSVGYRDEDPLDKNHNIDDIDEETLGKMAQDCKKFQEENQSILEVLESPNPHYSVEEIAGHDFWLTRNGHGAGFWDGNWPELEGNQLTDASIKYGEFNLYVGDDGKIYGN
uniref:Uncharacterized protein n=1 Tax=viral metagenome TaxID=1070528 RepID=A0A6M3KU12_9ZZZZ